MSTEEAIRLQAARHRREFMRWVLILAAHIARPAKSTLRMLLGVVQGEYPDATEIEVRRELGYLEGRELLVLVTDPLGGVLVDLTRNGIDVAEYTVAVDPGINRPPRA